MVSSVRTTIKNCGLTGAFNNSRKQGRGVLNHFLFFLSLKMFSKNYERYSIGKYSYSSSHQNIPQYAEVPPNVEVK
jgi:hypothetical protein